MLRYKEVSHRILCLLGWFLESLEVKESNDSLLFISCGRVSLVATTSEILWISQLLLDLQICTPSPALIFCDNTSAMRIANNPIFHECTKHIESDCHFIRDHIQKEVVKLLPVHTHLQLAYIFTKALFLLFWWIVAKMGVLDFMTPSWGGVLRL